MVKNELLMNRPKDDKPTLINPDIEDDKKDDKSDDKKIIAPSHKKKTVKPITENLNASSMINTADVGVVVSGQKQRVIGIVSDESEPKKSRHNSIPQFSASHIETEQHSGSGILYLMIACTVVGLVASFINGQLAAIITRFAILWILVITSWLVIHQHSQE
jgi:hypothetical protein